MRTRRILVALDASPPSMEAARTAAELAQALGADLLGLFVEDQDLLRLAGMPFARQLPMLGGGARPLEREAVEAQLRALASRARESLAREASPLHVTWTFEVRRGAVAAELLAAAGNADLLVVGARGHGGRGRRGGTAWAAAQQAGVSVVVVERRRRDGRGGPVLVAFDGSPGAMAALTAAKGLAGSKRDLAIACLAPDAGTAERLAERARDALPGVRGAARWAGGDRVEDLLAAARAGPPGLLVVDAASPLLAGGGLERLVASAPCPVVLAR
jgi:nucleotide-binding universal stress UspA family protein